MNSFPVEFDVSSLVSPVSSTRMRGVYDGIAPDNLQDRDCWYRHDLNQVHFFIEGEIIQSSIPEMQLPNFEEMLERELADFNNRGRKVKFKMTVG